MQNAMRSQVFPTVPWMQTGPSSLVWAIAKHPPRRTPLTLSTPISRLLVGSTLQSRLLSQLSTRYVVPSTLNVLWHGFDFHENCSMLRPAQRPSLRLATSRSKYGGEHHVSPPAEAQVEYVWLRKKRWSPLARFSMPWAVVFWVVGVFKPASSSVV